MNKQKYKHARDHETHYSDDRIDYIHIGTEFPTTEELRAAERQNSSWDGKPKGYSRDAFKGGFTAGYYNTVGSKEGWNPTATFVSSRANRAKPRDMRPEDFMDEEDLADMKAQQSVVRLSVEHGGLNEQEAHSLDGGNSGIVGLMARHVSAEFNALALSTFLGRSIGDTIMSAMGWKSGHGVGPLNRAVSAPRSGLNNSDFPRLPPKPTTRLVYEEQVRSKHGVDYGKDLSRYLASNTRHIANAKDSVSFLPSLGNLFKRPSANPQSASNLRDASEVPQKMESKKKKKKKAEMSRLSFGNFDDDDDDSFNYGGVARNSDSGSTHLERLASGIADSKTKAKLRIVASYKALTARCHDNKQPLPKFMLANSSDEPSTFDYNGPEVPESFTGIHMPTKKSRWDVTSSTDSDTATSCLQIFGEGVASASKADLHVEAATAKAALSGYMPFANNPEKQLRYRSYLEKCAGGQTNQAHGHFSFTEKEVAEFTRLAQTFRPNTTMLSRFVSAEESAAAAEEANMDSGGGDASPRKIAIKNVTRTTREWAPSLLLCKRLHIPAPANAVANRPKPKPKLNSEQEYNVPYRRQRAADFFEWNTSDQYGDSLIIPADDPASTDGVGVTASVTAVKPDPDLLLSVFGDSDSE